VTSIAFEEYARWVGCNAAACATLGSSPEELLASFRRYDIDHDGRLCMGELVAMLQHTALLDEGMPPEMERRVAALVEEAFGLSAAGGEGGECGGGGGEQQQQPPLEQITFEQYKVWAQRHSATLGERVLARSWLGEGGGEEAGGGGAVEEGRRNAAAAAAAGDESWLAHAVASELGGDGAGGGGAVRRPMAIGICSSTREDPDINFAQQPYHRAAAGVAAVGGAVHRATRSSLVLAGAARDGFVENVQKLKRASLVGGTPADLEQADFAEVF
jgi:hypothetical protein